MVESVSMEGLRLFRLRNRAPLPWVDQAAQAYKDDVAYNSTETSFRRGRQTIELLGRFFPSVSQRPNILIVGLGREGAVISECIVPHKIAAYFQGRGQDFAMTLLDKDPSVLADVVGRKTFYMVPGSGRSTSFVEQWEEWNKYLHDTGQIGRRVNVLEDSLTFRDDIPGPGNPYGVDRYLQDGIFAASVSPEFKRRIAKGSIHIREGDIATSDLINTGPYDFVDIKHVFYLLNTAGQQLALANIVRNLRPGGRIFLDDTSKTSGGTPLLDRYGGWLTKRKLRELGMVVESVNHSPYVKTSSLVLKKR